MVIKREGARQKKNTLQHAEMGAGPDWAGRVDVVFVVLQSLLLLLFFQHVLYLNYELLQTDKIISVCHPTFALSLSLFLPVSLPLFGFYAAEATVFHLFMSEFRLPGRI